MTSPRIFQWPKSRPTTPRNRTTKIVVHCSATPEGKSFDATDIDGWHLKRKFVGIGYHYVVHLDGSIEAGRPDHTLGSHVQGSNAESVAVVYIGGLSADGKKAKDTRTPDQKAALLDLLRHLKAKYRGAQIVGHRDLSPDKDKDGKVEPHEWLKDCPSFDAKTEYASL